MHSVWFVSGIADADCSRMFPDMKQGLQSLEMINVLGAYPTETEEFLSSLRGLTKLVVCNNTAAVKMAPMHCLASMPLLQVLPLN